MRFMASLDCSKSFQIKLLISEMVCSLFILVLLMTGCGDGTSRTETTVKIDTIPIKVKTCAVKVEKAKGSVVLSGFTEPIRRATPSARIMAKVIEAPFQEGDKVETDSLLICLDMRDLLARKRQAQSAVDTANTALDVAKLNLDRMRNLQASGSVSRHQLEATEVAHAQAKASVAATKSALDEIDVNLSYAVAYAPFQGVIVRKMVEQGNMVAPGQPLFIIEDDSSLRVIAPVGTDLAVGLTPGQTLPVRMGNDTVQGVIEGVVPSGSTEAPGLRVQLIIENGLHQFRAGTLAVVEVPLEKTEGIKVFVPKEAIIEKGQLTGAYVVTKDSRARLHWLILDEKPGDMVSVISGLYEGDRVILAPKKSGVTDGKFVEEIAR
jgi:RND family efflux transporter MFP subunit